MNSLPLKQLHTRRTAINQLDQHQGRRQLTSAMKLRVLVEELGSRAALIAIPSGVSSLAFAFEISDKTAVSLSCIWAVSSIFDFALIRADIIFLLFISFYRCYIAYQSSASVIEKLLGRSISWPYRLKYFAQVAWNVPNYQLGHWRHTWKKAVPSIRASASFWPNNTPNRFFISLAALLVKVTAVISIGRYPCFLTRWATREVSTLVFPDPGPARIWSGISGGWITAGRSVVYWYLEIWYLPLSWAGLSEDRYGYDLISSFASFSSAFTSFPGSADITPPSW